MGDGGHAGKDKWTVSTVKNVLQNEKYAGNALLQKSFCTDFLTKKMKKNEGEIPQYFVENSHPAIVPQETYDLVQDEIRRRRESGKRITGASLFSGRIICGNCGTAFGSKVWQSNNKYRRTVWQCNGKYGNKRNGSLCQTPHVTEEAVQTAFVRAFNQLLGDKEKYIAAFEDVLPVIADTSAMEKEMLMLAEERDVVEELIRKCVDDNAHRAQDQNAYQKKYDGLITRYETAKTRLEKISVELQERAARRERITRFLDQLRKVDDLLTEFDETHWCSMVENITVHTASDMTVTFALYVQRRYAVRTGQRNLCNHHNPEFYCG